MKRCQICSKELHSKGLNSTYEVLANLGKKVTYERWRRELLPQRRIKHKSCREKHRETQSVTQLKQIGAV